MRNATAVDRRMNRQARFSHVAWAKYARLYPPSKHQYDYGPPNPLHDDRWALHYVRMEGKR